MRDAVELVKKRDAMLDINAIPRLPDTALALSDAAAAGATSRAKSTSGEALTLLQRIASGASRAERARVSAMGYEAYLDEQLNSATLDDAAINTFIAQNLPTVGMNRIELYLRTRQMGGFGQISSELVVAVLLRSIYSRRQLFEAMVDFWGDVLNIQVNSAQQVVQKSLDDREVSRAHAFGRFRDLIGASARSPAMLLYLDNASNGINGINENYARELMELHTLGVDGGYTEADVVDVAQPSLAAA